MGIEGKREREREDHVLVLFVLVHERGERHVEREIVLFHGSEERFGEKGEIT